MSGDKLTSVLRHGSHFLVFNIFSIKRHTHVLSSLVYYSFPAAWYKVAHWHLMQWLYRYCIRFYCILCFRNITLIVDLCAYLLLLLSLYTFFFTYVFKCLYILPLYILCIYSFMYWKSGTSDLLVLMLFVLQCTDYKWNYLTLLTLMSGDENRYHNTWFRYSKLCYF